jgi:hypothetical protein
MLTIGTEYPPDGEEAAIGALAALHLRIHHLQPGPSYRGEHPKQHGGVWATLSVDADLPEPLRVGLFATTASYAAMVRFSSGSTEDDRQPDVRGMAIKVLVPGGFESLQVQDFVLADHPVFFARNVQHLFDFLTRVATGTPLAQLAADYPELPAFTRVATASLLATTYWSQTPYKLGASAVKYVATPGDAGPDTSGPLSATPDCLRESMIQQLSVRRLPARFDLSVQLQTDADSMPIEDPTIVWTSNPVRVASITIPPQEFEGEAQTAAFDSHGWSPWNALPEHRPLGGINRARRRVYAESDGLRHEVAALTDPRR